MISTHHRTAMNLLPHCSQLKPVTGHVLEDLVRELHNAHLPWTENYSAYHSGGWKTVALYNRDGDSSHNDLEDCEPIRTEAAEQLPRLGRFIEGLGLRLMWARLLKLEPGACLWEHTDYGADNLRPLARLRLHLPLTTNAQATIELPSFSVHMAAGHFWKLAPHRVRHAARNAGSEPRVHLLLDCYIDSLLRAWCDEESLDATHVRRKPRLTNTARLKRYARADALLREGKSAQADVELRLAFHDFDLGEASSYDLLADYFAQRGDTQRAAHWLQQKSVFLNTNVVGHPFQQHAV